MDVFGSLFLTIIWIFFLVAYLMVLFMLLTDLFRDQKLAGGWKAVWVIALLIFPLLAALVYLVARGRGMASRAAADAKDYQAQQEEYIRATAASADPVDQISKAKELHTAGVINDEEFAQLKSKALG